MSKPGITVSITLTVQEYRLLREEPIALDPDTHDLIKHATVQKGRYHITMPLSALEDLMDAVATETVKAGTEETRARFHSLLNSLAEQCPHQYGEDDSANYPKELSGLMHIVEQMTGSGQMDQHESFPSFFQAAIDQYHETPDPELGGLNPRQTFDLIEKGWWEESKPVHLNEDLPLTEVESGWFFHNTRIFLAALEETSGSPATAKGNLNRRFVAQMLERMNWPEGYLEEVRRYNKVINEDDARALHIIRVVCEIGGLARRYKQRWVLTRKAKQYLKDNAAGRLFAHLFDTFFHKFNLSYLDRLPETTGLQATIAYSLYMTGKLFGKEYREIEPLAAKVFLPKVIEEFEHSPTDRHYIEWLWLTRILQPLENFGLIEIRREKDKYSLQHATHARKTPLSDRFLSFDL